MDTGHSILAPSSGARNVQCPGSTLAEAQFPEDPASPSQESAEGTGAHWVLAERLAGRIIPEGTTTPNGMIVTDEMTDGAELGAEDVEFTLRCYGQTLAAVRSEQPVAITRVHPQCWGTPDVTAWAYGPPLSDGGTLNVVSNAARELLMRGGLHLFVWDYKFGHGPVEVYECQQLIDYAVGEAERVGVSDTTPGCVVHLKIIQPRAHHRDGVVREWVTTLIDLRSYVNRRSGSAHEALGPEPRLRVGPECKHCRARHACQELQRQAGNAADYAAGSQPLVLSPEALGLELLFLDRASKLMEARMSGLREQALQTMRRGARVPWWGIERSPGRVVWARPINEVQAVANAFGLSLDKPASLVTPKAAMELGLDPSIVKAMSQQNPGEAKLNLDNNEKTRRIFGR